MGRVVVITGGTSGIGLGLKELFEKNGDTVLTFSLDETGDTNHYQGSVDHEIKVKQVFNDIHERFGSIDMLINCAGIGMSAITEIAPMEQIRKVMEVNFFGTLNCMRSALPHMNSGARIVNLSSAMALFPVPFRGIYGASKSAILTLSMSMRMELAHAGIDVVAICPGDTKTNFTANRIKDFSSSERYGDRLETATTSSDAKEDKRMDVTQVVEKIFKVITKPKTKPFYIIGGKYKWIHFLTRITPKSMLIKATNKKLGGKFQKEVAKENKKPASVEAPSTPVEENVYTPSTETEVQQPVATQAVVTPEPAQQPTTTQPSAPAGEQKPKLNNILERISIINKPTDTDNNQE